MQSRFDFWPFIRGVKIRCFNTVIGDEWQGSKDQYSRHLDPHHIIRLQQVADFKGVQEPPLSAMIRDKRGAISTPFHNSLMRYTRVSTNLGFD